LRNPRRYKKKYKTRKYYQLNYRIQADKLRVLDEKGDQIGIYTKDEAINIAKDKDLDLVLITSQAKPPVAKIIDFKKFLYQQNKKEKEAKRGAKKSIVKDIKLSLFIAEADLERLSNKGKKFLSQGRQIRLNLPLKGREIIKKQRGIELLKKFILDLGEVSVSKQPRVEGRVIRAVVSRKK